MNIDDFENHHYRTPELEQVDRQLAQLFSSSDLDKPDNIELINQLAAKRKVLVDEELAKLSDDERTEFAQKELKLNDEFALLAQSLLKQVKDDIVTFLRSRKAANKYK